MDNYFVPVVVLTILFSVVVNKFLENRKRISWLRKNEGAFKVSRIHSVDVGADLNETTYGTSVRPMADVSDFKNHILRLYLFENGAAPLDRDQCVMIDSIRWQSFLIQVMKSSRLSVSDWLMYLLEEVGSRLYAPVSFYFQRRIRLAQCVSMSKLTDLKGGSVWSDPRARALGNKYILKFGCDEETLSIWWFDVFSVNEEQIVETNGVVRIPGRGMYSNPYIMDKLFDPYFVIHSDLSRHLIYQIPAPRVPLRPSSYTSLRDALVEEGSINVCVNNGHLCWLLSNSEWDLDENSIWQTDSNMSPLDVNRINRVLKKAEEFFDIDFLDFFRKPFKFFHPSFIYFALICLLIIRHLIFIQLTQTIGWTYVIVSLMFPPFATELCIALTLAGWPAVCQIIELLLVSLVVDLVNWIALLSFSSAMEVTVSFIAILTTKFFLCKLLASKY